MISVVVHDPGTLQMMALMISSWGYLTELYASAEEFLGAAATSEAACVVIDIDLGDISGVDLAIRLGAMGFKLPIIFITESQDEQHRQRAMDFGCTAFLLKPFSAERLIEAVRKAIGSKLYPVGRGMPGAPRVRGRMQSVRLDGLFVQRPLCANGATLCSTTRWPANDR